MGVLCVALELAVSLGWVTTIPTIPDAFPHGGEKIETGDEHAIHTRPVSL